MWLSHTRPSSRMTPVQMNHVAAGGSKSPDLNPGSVGCFGQGGPCNGPTNAIKTARLYIQLENVDASLKLLFM